MKTFSIVCAIALAAIVPSPALQAILATGASTLFESIPFILAGTLAARIAPTFGPRAVALFGCGCSHGPGALSLPVAAATALTFGPFVAAARWIAAYAVGTFFRGKADCAPSEFSTAAELHALLPFALLAGTAFALLPQGIPAHGHSIVAAVGAAALAAFASPCGFGAVALAAAARHSAPVAATAVLCIAGIVDLRSLRLLRQKPPAGHDGLGYLLASIACGFLAAHHGNTLVNPRFTLPLWGCCVALSALGWHHRDKQHAAFRFAPLVMLCACILNAPAPAYSAGETTLNDAFSGERLEFTGVLERSGGRSSLVRFTVTCCRADAQPVAVRLARAIPEPAGQWIFARGNLVENDGSLRLDVRTYRRIPAPADPFLYR
ncbi:MAG: hypothetical protein M3126_06835 [Candidatus Eremiobacteraeota bacterium]|nr:hypothetical protein [Candidatus Eremiobacteraeota bacterium]